MATLEPEICKTEPLDLPLKKSKLDEYAAYLYAATIDPLYIHAAMYEQWSHRPPLSAFRPTANIYPPVPTKDKPSRHQHHHRYKESPPILQHPERVVPLSESQRFERSFQPNVALAPPATIASRIHKAIKLEENLETVIQDPLENHQVVQETTKLVSPKEEDCATRSSVVDSTVSVVQSTGVVPAPAVLPTQRYNSEIELSTDTDDSLSDVSVPTCAATSGTAISGDELQRVLNILVDVPRETKDKVADIVRRLIGEHSKALKKTQLQETKIAKLEQRVAELESTKVGNTVNDTPAEYDVTVTSSRTDPTTQEDNNNSEESNLALQNDSPSMVSSCLPETNIPEMEDKTEETLKSTSADDVSPVAPNMSPTNDSEIVVKEEPE